MEHVIYKYEIPPSKEGCMIDLPFQAKVIHFGIQDGKPMIWCAVNLAFKASCWRKFRVVGTGHKFSEYPFEHIGTVFDGPFVWHLLEAK